MKRFLLPLAIAVCCLLFVELVNQRAQFQETNRRISAIDLSLARTQLQPLAQPSVQERVIDLPEDGNTWHTILFLRPDWQSRPAERRAHTVFFSETGLISLRHQTHWHVITTDQPEFQPFRALVNVTPCLLVERANGEVIYRESGPQLGCDNDGLRRAIRREVERHCPDGRCLPIHPTPNPQPGPVDEIPAILTVPEPKPEERSPLPALLASLAGLAGGAGLNWRKNG